MSGLGKFLLCLVILALASPCRAESLLELYQHTLESNPSLKSHEYSVDRANAQKAQALSKLLPQIFAVGNYSYNNLDQRAGRSSFSLFSQSAISAQYEGIRGTLQLRQALFDLASFFRWQGADSIILQSEQELEAARMAVAGDLVDRYLKALEASDDIGYVLAEKMATESQLQRLRHMHERQMAKVTDLYEVEAYYQALVTREIEAHNAKAVALEKLRELSGVTVRNVTSVNRDDFPPIPRSPDDWVQDATHHNPNLIALQHAINAAGKLVAGSWAEHAPQVALQVSETYADTGFDNRFQPPYTIFTAGVQVTVPIFEGGRVQAGVRDSEARQRIAREEYEQKRREIEQETRTAYLGVQASRARIASTGQETRAQAKATEAQERGYELGTTTIVDLLDTRRRLLKARVEQSKARYDYLRNLVGLRIRAGNLSDQAMAEISGWMSGK